MAPRLKVLVALVVLYFGQGVLSCGGNVNFLYGPTYTFSTPGFPASSYQDAQECIWTVEVPAYHSVQVVVGQVNLRGNPLLPECAASDKVEFVTPAGTSLAKVCNSNQAVNTIDRTKFTVRLRPAGFAESSGGVLGFSIELRAVPYYDLNCKTDGFEISLPFNKLQNPQLYPYATYQLLDSNCKATVLSDRVTISGGYSTCGSVSDPNGAGISNTVQMVPRPAPAPPRPTVSLPFLCKFPSEQIVVSTDYDPVDMLPFWSRRTVRFPAKTQTRASSHTRAVMFPLEADIDFSIRLNVFNNDEFHSLGEPSMWRPSDMFFEVEAVNASSDFVVAAEECWYTATSASDDQLNRYTFLHGGCPTDSDPIERYPSSNHHDRFAHTLGLDLPGSGNRHFVHCRVMICTESNSASCSKDCVTPPPPTTTPSPVLPGSLSGAIKDAVTLSEIPSAQIFVNQGFTEIGTTSSAPNGLYGLSLPPATGYTVTFQTPGYHTAIMSNVEIVSAQNTVLEALMFIDVAYVGVGTASGTIRNAFDGAAESGVTLDFRAGINVHTGTVLGSTTTGSTGYWEITNLNTGHYTVAISKPGYTNNSFTVIVLGGQRKDNQNGVISPIISSGKVRVILTWGPAPSDLDSHATGPTDDGSDRFYVFYGRKGSDHVSPYVSLDVDDTSSYGPETVTINRQFSGTYRYSVRDYTNGGNPTGSAMANSGAVVKVLFGDSSVPARTFHVPSSPGVVWTVFELNGDVLTPINTVCATSCSY